LICTLDVELSRQARYWPDRPSSQFADASVANSSPASPCAADAAAAAAEVEADENVSLLREGSAYWATLGGTNPENFFQRISVSAIYTYTQRRSTPFVSRAGAASAYQYASTVFWRLG
jgi:hypothetical protein